MKKNRLIFYAIFGAFHLFLTIFAFYVDSQKGDIAFLGKMLSWIPLMKWGAVLGLILLVTDIVWNGMGTKELRKENAALNHEMNILKAKLFDLQEDAKRASQSSNPNVKQ